MRRDHLNAVVSQLLIQRIAVVGAIADQILRLGFDHVEVEAECSDPHQLFLNQDFALDLVSCVWYISFVDLGFMIQVTVGFMRGVVE